MGRLMEGGSHTSNPNPLKMQKPPVTEIHTSARCSPGIAAGLSGSVAVSICKLTTDSVTSKTIIPTSMPTPTSNLVFIFIRLFPLI